VYSTEPTVVVFTVYSMKSSVYARLCPTIYDFVYDYVYLWLCAQKWFC